MAATQVARTSSWNLSISPVVDLEIECDEIENELHALANRSMLRRHSDEGHTASVGQLTAPPEQIATNRVVRLAHRLQWLAFASQERTLELSRQIASAQAGVKALLQDQFLKDAHTETLLAYLQLFVVEFVSPETGGFSTSNFFYTSTANVVVLEFKFHPIRCIPRQEFIRRVNHLGVDIALGIYTHGLPPFMKYLQRLPTRNFVPCRIYDGVCRTEADLRILAANFDRLHGSGERTHTVVSIIDTRSSVASCEDVQVMEIGGFLYSVCIVQGSGGITRAPCDDSMLQYWYQDSHLIDFLQYLSHQNALMSQAWQRPICPLELQITLLNLQDGFTKRYVDRAVNWRAKTGLLAGRVLTQHSELSRRSLPGQHDLPGLVRAIQEFMNAVLEELT
ncbi:hypothetical protein B0A52_08457 [Exophiala mesophila]|uniref:Uncharacterized protein n=1 Tax=Exophiala mesophila TaxID=212818 RepID=A0A438MWC0_EXOME|nr:hypothetical protein B0A52_08457 [Exophiala mesophila]